MISVSVWQLVVDTKYIHSLCHKMSHVYFQWGLFGFIFNIKTINESHQSIIRLHTLKVCLGDFIALFLDDNTYNTVGKTQPLTNNMYAEQVTCYRSLRAANNEKE